MTAQSQCEALAQATGPSANELLGALRRGERRALARALSDAESRHPAHRARLDALWTLSGPAPSSALRVAFTGPPGAGKSTLIESLGVPLLAAGERVAVLPVDPSSQISGGSLLADQTRMTELSRHPNAFIRPSAAGQVLGGLAAHTLESIELCELAGYDWVLLETVGVGQNEIDAAAAADLVVLVLTPDAGDDLQALKRGVTEICHALVVNKGDGDRAIAAEQLGTQYTQAAHLMGGREIPLFVTSARDGIGVDALCAWLRTQQARWAQLGEGRELSRRTQRLLQFERSARSNALAALLAEPQLAALYASARDAVSEGRASASGALEQLFEGVANRLGVTAGVQGGGES
jgi:LAO/AO transport system kinase